MKSIGVDVGGTFTDLIYFDSFNGNVGIHKVATTPDDPSLGVIKGIKALCELNNFRPLDIDHIFHGTTIATNSVLECDGVKAGMITNNGFRDVLHIGRHQRVEHYSIMQQLPWQDRPLIARRHRKTVSGRLIPPKGEQLVPLNEDEVRQAAKDLLAAGVEAVAICFLFSYLNQTPFPGSNSRFQCSNPAFLVKIVRTTLWFAQKIQRGKITTVMFQSRY